MTPINDDNVASNTELEHRLVATHHSKQMNEQHGTIVCPVETIITIVEHAAAASLMTGDGCLHFRQWKIV